MNTNSENSSASVAPKGTALDGVACKAAIPPRPVPKGNWPKASTLKGVRRTQQTISLLGVTVPAGPGQWKAAKVELKRLKTDVSGKTSAVMPKPAMQARHGIPTQWMETLWSRINDTRTILFANASEECRQAISQVASENGREAPALSELVVDFYRPPASGPELSVHAAILRTKGMRSVPPLGMRPADAIASAMASKYSHGIARERLKASTAKRLARYQSASLKPTELYKDEFDLCGVNLDLPRWRSGSWPADNVRGSAAPANWKVLYTDVVFCPGGVAMSAHADLVKAAGPRVLQPQRKRPALALDP